MKVTRVSVVRDPRRYATCGHRSRYLTGDYSPPTAESLHHDKNLGLKIPAFTCILPYSSIPGQPLLPDNILGLILLRLSE